MVIQKIFPVNILNISYIFDIVKFTFCLHKAYNNL